MGSKQRSRHTQAVRCCTQAPGPRRQILALVAVTALVLSACSATADDTEPEIGAEPKVSTAAAVTNTPSAPSDTGVSEAANDASSDTASSVDVDTAGEGTEEPAPADAGQDDTGQDTEEGATPEAAPSRPDLQGEALKDTQLPPGYSSADSILMEEAFDGPDLHLASMTSSSEENHRVEFFVEGMGYPGWRVAYADGAEARSASTASTLEVVLVGVDPAAELPVLPTSSAVRVERADRAEDGLSVLVHLDQPAKPFRVHLQHDPLRVVVEVTAGR